MRKAALLLVVLAACDGTYAPISLGGKARWNLDQPFYIEVSPTMPKAQLVLEAMRTAVGRAGGSLTVETSAEQKLTLLDTDASYCQGKGVEAFAALPATGKIYFCHSATVLASYTAHDMELIAAHELGHVLSNHGSHLGGEPPAGSCPSYAMMSANRTCRSSEAYTDDDKEYICGSLNAAGGICRKGPSTVSVGRDHD